MQASGTHRSSLADDFTDMVSHHYSESIETHRKWIPNVYLDANGQNVNKRCGCLVNPVVAQVTANCWSKA